MLKPAIFIAATVLILLIFLSAGRSTIGQLSNDAFLMDRVTESMTTIRILTPYREDPDAERLAKLAEADPEAAYELGRRYVSGRGQVADFSLGVIWMNRAVEKGHVPAAEFLGEFYNTGRASGVKDAKTATKYYTIAAEHGSITGSHYLCTNYAFRKDYEAALPWCLAAAEKGIPMSMGILGEMYARGEGVEQDLEKAKHYICLAKDSGRMMARVMQAYGMVSCE